MSFLTFIPDLTAPEPAKAGYLKTPDGFELRYALFRSQAEPVKGSVILLQGRNECIEKYAETIGDLLDRGFDVCTFDWRGQGGSTRYFKDTRRGYVDDFDQYASDLELMITEVFLPDSRPPFFVVAHSMGALIALLAAPAMTNRIDRMVLSTPFLGLGEEGLPRGVVRTLAWTMRALGLGRLHMGGGGRGIMRLTLETNPLTGDARRFARNQVLLDPEKGLGLGAATAGWLDAAIAAIGRVHDPEHMANIRIPALVVTAGADRVVSSGVATDYARRLRSASVVNIAGARHELMQETDAYRDQFFAALEAFIPGLDG